MVNDLTRQSLDAVEDLILTFPYKPYRNHRLISRRRQSDVLRAELDAALASGDAFGLMTGTGAEAAAVVITRLPWDTALFDVSMAKVLCLLHGSDASGDALREIVRAAIARSRDCGLQHLAIRVDVGDVEVVHALEANGFQMMETLVTHLSQSRPASPRPVKEVGVVRPFQPCDAPQILEITREAYKGFRGRYRLDPHLRADRADQTYVEWARKCCSGQWADTVIVVENGEGELYGWLGYRRMEPVSTVSGADIRGAGLAACRNDRPGAYAGLVRATVQRIHAEGGVLEAQTQIFNFPAIRVYEAIGMAFVRAQYTMHRVID